MSEPEAASILLQNADGEVVVTIEEALVRLRVGDHRPGHWWSVGLTVRETAALIEMLADACKEIESR